ncbi:hypothetical protein [uncultured Imperialibacter sp.]|jgi:hypothetical protein|uniref:hypothetical protein n=1 Tax=Imperialibacter sp. TaxID=2038411 RepID=UPI0030DDC4D6|tara:strand:- start:28872 stop:29459 length:588 start_codon:yes stop_codon:yes gene_type:complete
MRTIFTTLILCSLFSCGSEEDQTPGASFGSVTAVFNDSGNWVSDEVYTATPRPAFGEEPCSPNLIDVGIRKWNEKSPEYVNISNPEYVNIHEKLVISSIQLEPGTQDLNKTIGCNGRTRFYTNVGGDMLADIYEIDTLEANWIRIEDIDEVNGEVTGRFELHFQISSMRNRQLPEWPDKVTLSSGVFSFKLPSNM